MKILTLLVALVITEAISTIPVQAQCSGGICRPQLIRRAAGRIRLIRRR